MTTPPPPESDYRARLFADNIAAFEALITGIERVNAAAPAYAPILASGLEQRLKDMRTQGNKITLRVLQTFDEDRQRDEAQQALEKRRLEAEEAERKARLNLDTRRFAADAVEKERKFKQDSVEAARLHRQRWFILGVSLAIILVGDALAIWILSAGSGTLNEVFSCAQQTGG